MNIKLHADNSFMSGIDNQYIIDREIGPDAFVEIVYKNGRRALGYYREILDESLIIDFPDYMGSRECRGIPRDDVSSVNKLVRALLPIGFPHDR